LPPTEPSRSPQHAILFQSTVTARSQHAVTCCGTCLDPIILWRRAIDQYSSRLTLPLAVVATTGATHLLRAIRLRRPRTWSQQAGATAHRHTKSRTFPAEGFRATSIPKNRSICSQYICEQQCLPHDAPRACPRRRSTGRNRRAATSDDRVSKETSHLSARSVLEDPSILLVQNW